MKRILALTLLGMMVVGTGFAADSSRLGLGIEIDPVPPIYNVRSMSDVFIASSTNGNFTDLSPLYDAALMAAGASSVSIITDSPDSPFTFPSPFTANEYGTLVILTNDNWWGASGGQPEANVSLTDEITIAAYMDTGGTLLFSGQDYLYGRGDGNGFPQIYLGIQTYSDDINFGDTDIDYVGLNGPLAGLTGHLHAETGPLGSPCFESNPFYSDDITPFAGIAFDSYDYTSMPTNVSGQGGTVYDVGAFKTLFTAVDFACTDDTAQFQRDLTAMYTWLVGGATAVDDATWGSVKNLYK